MDLPGQGRRLEGTLGPRAVEALRPWASGTGMDVGVCGMLRRRLAHPEQITNEHASTLRRAGAAGLIPFQVCQAWDSRKLFRYFATIAKNSRCG